VNIHVNRPQILPVTRSDVDHVTGAFEEPALDEDAPLDGERCEDESEADWGPGIALEESHQKADTEEDHDVHVLEPGVVADEMLIRFFEELASCSRLGSSALQEIDVLLIVVNILEKNE
jgi:hypothetical protein